MSATVLTFATTCPACSDALHDSCWQYLGELINYEHVPCKCDCRDEHGELTQAALMEMMRRHPEVVARRIRFDASLARGSLGQHFTIYSGQPFGHFPAVPVVEGHEVVGPVGLQVAPRYGWEDDRMTSETETKVTDPSRSEQIVYLTDWAAKNGCTLQIHGQVGIGRDCVGIIGTSESYVDTESVSCDSEWWQPENAYHKSDCLAVLGHGDGPLLQLYRWVRWLDDHGYRAEVISRTPTSQIDLLLHGVSLTVLVPPQL